MSYQQGNYTISTDKAKLDIAMIHDYLCNESYWANGRLFSTVQKAIENSFCFGLYHHDDQVGFARVVTDYATFGWLCDVFILDNGNQIYVFIGSKASHDEKFKVNYFEFKLI